MTGRDVSLLGDDGRPDVDSVLDVGGRVASATNRYETWARVERVDAGRLPGRRKEKGKPCASSVLRVLGVGINIQVCNVFDRVAQTGQLCPIGRRVVTSMTNFISNFATSNVSPAELPLPGTTSRMPLNNDPVESTGSPKLTSGGLSIRIFRTYGSLPTTAFLSPFGERRSFLAGFGFSFDARRWSIMGQSMRIPGVMNQSASPMSGMRITGWAP
jgi:hypothetical protein